MQTPQEPNYDEAKVPQYTLPDPLLCEDGTPVKNAEQWKHERRPEILEIFRDQVYGYSPEASPELCWETTEEYPAALNGAATRKQVDLWFRKDKSGPRVRLLLHIPNARRDGEQSTFPAFLGLNFRGNHTVHEAEEISINSFKADEPRGVASRRWPLELVISRGYASVTACYHDIDPDVNDFTNGVHPLYYEEGQTRPGPNQWGAIGAWAWGLSRILDYLEQEGKIDAARVAVHGHSRLGKTALWAAAQDERFALCISNNSGCAGAAISRRGFGETVQRINNGFPHWFCENFKAYNNNEPELPIDQHQLIALIAPRPVYVASATEDLWADPRGEFLSAFHAGPVYELFGKSGLSTNEMPEQGASIGGSIGYHLREGKHDILREDWEHYLNFADRHFNE